jgi:hypothetical protein
MFSVLWKLMMVDKDRTSIVFCSKEIAGTNATTLKEVF